MYLVCTIFAMVSQRFSRLPLGADSSTVKPPVVPCIRDRNKIGGKDERFSVLFLPFNC